MYKNAHKTFQSMTVTHDQLALRAAKRQLITHSDFYKKQVISQYEPANLNVPVKGQFTKNAKFKPYTDEDFRALVAASH